MMMTVLVMLTTVLGMTIRTLLVMKMRTLLVLSGFKQLIFQVGLF